MARWGRAKRLAPRADELVEVDVGPALMWAEPAGDGSGYATTMIRFSSAQFGAASSMASTRPLVEIAATAPESFSRYSTSLARN